MISLCQTTIYEDRSFNMLRNIVILLVFQIEKKIGNIRFVGNFILKACRNCVIFLTSNLS